MQIEYEFQIYNNKNNEIKKNIFDYIEKLNDLIKSKNKKIVIKSASYDSEVEKNTYKCYRLRDLSKIVKKVTKSSDANLIYIIKNDEKNDILDVLFDTDTRYFNSEIATEKENEVLAHIYNQNI